MYKELNITEADNLLYEVAPFACERFFEVGLSIFLRYYRFHSAYQFTFVGNLADFHDALKSEQLPSVPEGEKATVVFEVITAGNMNLLDDVEMWLKDKMGDSLFRFEQVFSIIEQPFSARITIIFHDAERRRSHKDSLVLGCHTMKHTDIKIAKILDKELERNEKIGAVVAQDTDSLLPVIEGHHLLWSEITNSTKSAEEVYNKLGPEMEREIGKYDISGILLFFEVDRKFTTMGEIDGLKNRFSSIVGKDADIVINVRLTDSYIKYITCRVVLVGNPPFIKGEVYEDFGRYEILLYEGEDEKRDHVIVASYGTDNEFCLSRYDWGMYDYSSRGQTDDHHYFDAENTAKLFAALRVKKPATLLRTIRKRFASRFPSMADSELLDFCRARRIEFDSDYHY